MNCTSCGKRVKDDAAICPHCDAILDTSFLGDLPEGGNDDDDTPPPEPEPPRPSRPARPAPNARPAAAAPKPTTQARPARAPLRKAPLPVDEPEEEATIPPPAEPKAGPGGYVNKYSQYWEEEPGEKKAAPAATGAAERSGPPRPSLPADSGAMRSEDFDPLDYFRRAWAWFKSLHFEDRLTTASAVSLVFFSLWPWRSTPEGDEIGLLTWGFVTSMLAAAAIAAVWARKDARFEGISLSWFPKGTIGVGGLSALICAIYAITAFERQTVAHGFGRTGKEVVTLSSPSLGVFLALLAAAGVGVGGFLTMKREKLG
ncbi:MAG: zinc ribbon domain-containing protein [Myxococcales bacterium]